MKFMPSIMTLFLASTVTLFGQAPGFGSAGAAGAAFQGGDPSLLTQRILSTTKYKLTPGDTYQLTIALETTVDYPLVLQENYDVEIPYMGTKNVKGLYFTDLRTMVMTGLKKLLPLSQYISLTLLSPARFDVPVFGGVQTPGMVTVYTLAQVTDAINLAGHLKPGASYRQIMLLRGDQKIPVDLLRYSGDAAAEEDPYLQPGDKIMVPQAQLVVSLTGEVKYPGSIELLPGETLQALIAYAGGVLPNARTSRIEIARFSAEASVSHLVVDLSTGGATPLSDGDNVRVPSVVENDQMVLVVGAVFGSPVSANKPVVIPTQPVSVNIPYTPGLSLLTVLDSLGGPTPFAKAKESVVIRKKTGERVAVDVEALWVSRDPALDVPLEPGDSVVIPLVTDVFVSGEVRVPGRIPFNPALVVSDYLTASGGINPDTADPNGIYFVDKLGKKTKAQMTSNVAPGAVIVVDQSSWIATTKQLNNINLVATVATTIVLLIGYLIPIIKVFWPNFPH